MTRPKRYLLFLCLDAKKSNKRLYLGVEKSKDVLNDQRELKIKSYAYGAIRAKPLANGTSTRLLGSNKCSLLTPGKALTDAPPSMLTILRIPKIVGTLRVASKKSEIINQKS